MLNYKIEIPQFNDPNGYIVTGLHFNSYNGELEQVTATPKWNPEEVYRNYDKITFLVEHFGNVPVTDTNTIDLIGVHNPKLKAKLIIC